MHFRHGGCAPITAFGPPAHYHYHYHYTKTITVTYEVEVDVWT
jgi:hypothetical protein